MDDGKTSAGASVNCPSCATIFEGAVERCPKCRLTLRRLDLKFGTIPRHAAYLTDRTERVPIKDVQRAREELRLFAKQFPQCVLSVFVIDLAPEESLNEYAFWLANRGRFSPLESLGNDNFDLLLVVDFANKNATLAAGYALEEFVVTGDLAEALEGATPALREANVPDAVHEVTERLAAMLRRASDDAKRAAAQVMEETR